MNVYNIIALIISMLGISTVTGLIWKDLHDKKLANSEHVKELKKREAQDNLRGVIQEENKNLQDSVIKIQDTIDIISEGTLCVLRNDILKGYYDCVKKGFRNDYDYTNIHELYDAYQKLHGNSFVADIIKRFDKLPTEEEYNSSKEKINN